MSTSATKHQARKYRHDAQAGEKPALSEGFEIGVHEKRILLESFRAFNEKAWERLYSIEAGRSADKLDQAVRDIATSADKIDELMREIAEIEEAEAARHNARIEDDERNMRGWQR